MPSLNITLSRCTTAVVHLDNVILRLGIVSFENNQPILLTSDVTNLENLRAVTND